MYKIIGADGQPYGPVNAEQIRRWILEKRIKAETLVQIEGATEWKPLESIPELAAELKTTSSGTPVQPPIATTVSKNSGMAVASLVLGILGVFTCGITALFGLILGIIAMVKVSNSRGALRGGGVALAGVIVSGVFLIMIPIFAAMLLPALAAAHDKAREINCMNNEKQLALAVKMYSDDNNGQFPPAATWCDAITRYTVGSGIFKCPAADPASRCDYAFNSKLGGMDMSKVNPQTVMIFESDAGWNASGGQESLTANPRHMHGRIYVVAFVDGHVEAVNQSQLNVLR
jgi:prepilin-type processing-associated H-X9-DG protein